MQVLAPPRQAVVLALALVAMVASSPAQPFVTALFVDHLVPAADVSRALFSLIYTVSTLAAGFGLIWVGAMIDRLAPPWVWLIGSLGLAAALIVTSLANSPVLVLVAFFLLRLFGIGALTMLGITMVSRAFDANRGRAVALTILGITGSTVVVPPIVERLIEAVGWRDANRVLALAVVALAVPTLLALRRIRLSPRTPAAPAAGAPPVLPATVEYPPAYLSRGRLPFALPTPPMRRLLVINAMPALIVSGLIFHATSLLATKGLTTREAALAISFQGIASTLGIFASGAIVDRLRTRMALGIGTVLVCGAPLAALGPSAAAGIAMFALVGLGGASLGVAANMVWPRVYGTAEIGRLQAASGAVQTAAAALGPVPLAVSQSLTGSFEGGLLFLAAAGAAGLVSVVRWRDPRHVRPALPETA